MISEERYHQAILRISKVKHTNLDQLMRDAKPLAQWKLALSEFFSTGRLQSEQAGIEGLLTILVTQEGLPTDQLHPDEYGRWALSGTNLIQLRSLYRSQTLQGLVDTLRAERKVVDAYAGQATVKPLLPRDADGNLINPPAVRVQDELAAMNAQLQQDSKRYERIAAKESLRQINQSVKRQNQELAKLKQQAQKGSQRVQKKASK